jgi:hypothetical protein
MPRLALVLAFNKSKAFKAYLSTLSPTFWENQLCWLLLIHPKKPFDLLGIPRLTIVWPPQNQSRPPCKDGDEETWDKSDFHDVLPGLTDVEFKLPQPPRSMLALLVSITPKSLSTYFEGSFRLGFLPVTDLLHGCSLPPNYGSSSRHRGIRNRRARAIKTAPFTRRGPNGVVRRSAHPSSSALSIGYRSS